MGKPGLWEAVHTGFAAQRVLVPEGGDASDASVLTWHNVVWGSQSPPFLFISQPGPAPFHEPFPAAAASRPGRVPPALYVPSRVGPV